MKSFTLESFAKELGSIRAKVPINLSIAAQSIGEVLDDKATKILGTYQFSDMGGFAPWDELSWITKLNRIDDGYTPNDPGVASGEMRSTIDFNVSGHSVQMGSNSPHIEQFEYGVGRKQPPRPVIGLAAHRSEHEVDLINKLVVKRVFK